MRLVFRSLDPRTPSDPLPGEVVLVPGDPAQRVRRDLSRLALEAGPAAFLRGSGAPLTLVLRLNPTLDDLLASAIVAARLRGETLPGGVRLLAEYAALSREGIRPGDVPLEVSLEGIFQAVRNLGDGKLENPSTAAAFAAEWERLRAALFEAAAKGLDPFHDAYLAKDPAFARARSFLARDRDVYRQDVRRGRRWLGRLPGYQTEVAILTLVEPKSLLAKYWSRQDTEAPVGGEYLLLAVRWAGQGEWVFSTDPVHRVPIAGLAAELQRVESSTGGSGVWFDGAPFQHTLIAAPSGGTALSDDQVLATFRTWCGAREVREQRPIPRWVPYAAGASLAAMVVTATVFQVVEQKAFREQLEFVSRNGYRVDPTVVERIEQGRGAPLDRSATQGVVQAAVEVPGFAILVCVGHASGPNGGQLPGACSDTGRLYNLLTTRYGYSPDQIELLGDDPSLLAQKTGLPREKIPRPTRAELYAAMRRTHEKIDAWESLRGEGAIAQVLFYFAGHGSAIETGERLGYLVLDGFDPAQGEMTGARMDQLPGDVRGLLKGSHKLVLLDNCFSGLAVLSRDATSDARIYELWKEKAFAVISASTGDQQAYERMRNKQPESLFMTALFRALGDGDKPMLADANTDGVVTDAELGSYLRSEVTRELGDDRQTPMYLRGLEGDDAGQFLFIRRQAAPLSVAAVAAAAVH